MGKSLKPCLVLFICISFLFPPLGTCALAQDPGQEDNLEAGRMAVDFILVRPLSLATTVLGTALFIVSLPFSALGRNVKDAAKTLVAEPAKFTFTRPLGEM